LASTIITDEKDFMYHKVLTNLMAVLIGQEIVAEDLKKLMKEKLGMQCWDVLAVNTQKLSEEIWLGLKSSPLEHSNFIEDSLLSLPQREPIVLLC
jgi:hypothetical protein